VQRKWAGQMGDVGSLQRHLISARKRHAPHLAEGIFSPRSWVGMNA
jgi:hypothetical protein